VKEFVATTKQEIVDVREIVRENENEMKNEEDKRRDL